MTSAIRRMGILYGKLGLATDAGLIEKRAAGVEAAAKALKVEHIGELLRILFGLRGATKPAGFLTQFSEVDPTFDVQPSDYEAALLAGSVVAYEMEKGTDITGKLALCLVTASFGGIRQPIVDNQLISIGDQTLAREQGNLSVAYTAGKYYQQPRALTEAVQSLQQIQLQPNPQNFVQAHPHIVASIQALCKYAENNARAAAVSDNEILDYVRRLEEELRTYWWVSGGWSSDAGKPFRDFSADEAALRAGKELADKNAAPLGLLAAPALIDMVVERGRKSEIKTFALAAAAIRPERAWRSSTFGAPSAGPLADLVPVTSALGFAATSDDDADWQPRFRRLTRIDPAVDIRPLDLGLQMYRERL